MQAAGKLVRPGQRVRFLYTLGPPGVSAWDVYARPDLRSIDLARYRVLLQRAVQTILAPVEKSFPVGEQEACLYLFPALAVSAAGV
jgi:hypothetical protein